MTPPKKKDTEYIKEKKKLELALLRADLWKRHAETFKTFTSALPSIRNAWPLWLGFAGTAGGAFLKGGFHVLGYESPSTSAAIPPHPHSRAVVTLTPPDELFGGAARRGSESLEVGSTGDSIALNGEAGAGYSGTTSSGAGSGSGYGSSHHEAPPQQTTASIRAVPKTEHDIILWYGAHGFWLFFAVVMVIGWFMHKKKEKKS